MSDDPENIVWKGGPSQIVNLPAFLASALVAMVFIVVGPQFSAWKWLVVRCHRFEISTERLRMMQGVLNRNVDELELYRVKDSRVLQPLWLRIFGLGHVVLETSDRSHPKATLNAIKGPRQVGEILRREVESLREKKRVREIDFDEVGDSEFGGEVN